MSPGRNAGFRNFLILARRTDGFGAFLRRKREFHPKPAGRKVVGNHLPVMRREIACGEIHVRDMHLSTLFWLIRVRSGKAREKAF